MRETDWAHYSQRLKILRAVEGKITRAYLQYAQMIQFGVVRPGAVDEDIKRKRAKIDQRSYLTNLLASDAQAFFKRVYPQNREYARLLQEKERLFGIIARGGWGAPVTGGKLQPVDLMPTFNVRFKHFNWITVWRAMALLAMAREPS